MNRIFLNVSVGRNLTISLVLLLIVVVTSATLLFAVVIHHSDKKELEHKGDELINNIVKSIEFPIWNFDIEAANKICEAYFLSEYVCELVIYEAYTDRVIIDKKRFDKEDKKRELFFIEAPIYHNNVSIASVRIGLTTRFAQDRLINIFYSYLVTSVVITLILVLMTSYLLKIFLKTPFNNLIQGMERVSQGTYAYNFDNAPREKEFSAIVSRFKEMACKIQKREESLSRAKNYISVVFDSMDFMIISVDQALKLTHCNKAAEHYTGSSMSEATGEAFVEIFPEFVEIYESIWNAVDRRISHTGLRVSFENSGEMNSFSISILPISFEGEDGAVIKIQDITEDVRLEEIMIQTEKMISVGGLAAGMAHEINNPLAGILQNMQVIENRTTMTNLPANIDAARTCGTDISVVVEYMNARSIPELFKSVKEAGSRAARIVENMLSFSRKSNSGFIECNIESIVNDTLELASNDYDLKKKYDFKNIHIIREFQENLPSVPCDGIKIQQVLFNIFKNGAQVMVENDIAETPPCFKIYVSAVEQSSQIEIRIEDNGPGMDEETRKHIFEPFFTTKPVGVGTGLGLSVSYFIITENHGGTMKVESSPGNGAAFIIRLPLQQIKAHGG
ncbi:putative Signal transduction histidine kinase, nitrogen specific, NtrB [Desulfamplus magnetovallimortis]|uniref:histidine kinase n=1 Tax=Desulfamplus magnetovallimortis TaxID=1246637 RepID=A0A1W1HL61_9BACT|nr:ATP-binding protein [Desulfamplus magnetovallimortis]SLM33200.1 putative Signal transduction histidine kinase, nitrogen specific, NtrB [Desulfamplus magnetovallimortis]